MRSLKDIALLPKKDADPAFIAVVERVLAFMAIEHLASIVRGIECSEVER